MGEGMDEPIRELHLLLKHMKPSIRERDLVYVLLKESDELPDEVHILCKFKEDEGNTLIVRKSVADEMEYDYEGSWTRIILQVHSSLDAVGFIAEIASELARHGISTNIFSAYFHDHILVQSSLADKAIDILRDLTGTKLK